MIPVVTTGPSTFGMAAGQVLDGSHVPPDYNAGSFTIDADFDIMWLSIDPGPRAISVWAGDRQFLLGNGSAAVPFRYAGDVRMSRITVDFYEVDEILKRRFGSVPINALGIRWKIADKPILSESITAPTQLENQIEPIIAEASGTHTPAGFAAGSFTISSGFGIQYLRIEGKPQALNIYGPARAYLVTSVEAGKAWEGYLYGEPASVVIDYYAIDENTKNVLQAASITQPPINWRAWDLTPPNAAPSNGGTIPGPIVIAETSGTHTPIGFDAGTFTISTAFGIQYLRIEGRPQPVNIYGPTRSYLITFVESGAAWEGYVYGEPTSIIVDYFDTPTIMRKPLTDAGVTQPPIKFRAWDLIPPTAAAKPGGSTIDQIKATTLAGTHTPPTFAAGSFVISAAFDINYISIDPGIRSLTVWAGDPIQYLIAHVGAGKLARLRLPDDLSSITVEYSPIDLHFLNFLTQNSSEHKLIRWHVSNEALGSDLVDDKGVFDFPVKAKYTWLEQETLVGNALAINFLYSINPIYLTSITIHRIYNAGKANNNNLRTATLSVARYSNGGVTYTKRTWYFQNGGTIGDVIRIEQPFNPPFHLTNSELERCNTLGVAAIKLEATAETDIRWYGNIETFYGTDHL